MTTVEFGAHNVAHASLIALQKAEAALMPNPECHSRLFVAITACETAMSYIAFPTESSRTRLRLRLEDLQRVQTDAINMGQLPKGCLIGRGLNLAIFVTQTALAGSNYSPEFALHEAQAITRLAGRGA